MERRSTSRQPITIILLLVLLAVIAGFTANAEEVETFTSGDYKYVLAEDGTAVITGYNGEYFEVTIPKVLDGYLVSRIDDTAFFIFLHVSEVTIPESITELGANPWAYCEYLSKINVYPWHPTLTVIDDVLYSMPDNRVVCCPRNSKNDSLKLAQDTMIIDDFAFYCCTKLTEITIPDSVTYIGNFAFNSCYGLRELEIPESVTFIGNKAFYWCTKLTEITIPENVTFIGDCAFYGCRGLTEIAIPESVTALGVNPWAYCENLTTINISPCHPTLTVMDGVLCSKQDMQLISYPTGSIKSSFEIPQGIRVVGDYAFTHCTNLTKITLPNGVISIGNDAFSRCENLVEIIIPDGVISIGNNAFDWCKSLKKITIPDSVSFIGKWAFSNCDNPSVIVTEGSYAEQYCIDNKLTYTYPDALD